MAARAAVLVAVLRAGLAVLPFRVVLGIVKAVAPGDGPRAAARPRASREEAELALWGAAAAGRAVLRRNPCLPRALAALILLRRRGVPAELRIGVARDEGGALKAHAWVESEGAVVAGGDVPLAEYERLPSLPTGPLA
jgi:hypothetical protein